jgi:hypothetical protein
VYHQTLLVPGPKKWQGSGGALGSLAAASVSQVTLNGRRVIGAAVAQSSFAG